MKSHILGGDFDTTNIRMEGRAIIEALKDANGEDCEIYSDSEFWIKVITIWSLPWEANGWKKKGGLIKNLDLVQEVCPLYKQSKASLIWVRGHNGHDGNELADEWANKARQQQLEKRVISADGVNRTPIGSSNHEVSTAAKKSLKSPPRF